MRTLKKSFCTCLPLVFFTLAAHAAAQTPCDAPELRLSNNTIQIEPSGIDDTQNVQCALDLAVEKNIPEIRLTRGVFRVSTLYIENFNGTLQGSGAAHTQLFVGKGPIDCDVPGLVTFARGELRIRWLTISIDRTFDCVGANSLILFTGLEQTAPFCSLNILRGVIDRVVLGRSETTPIGPPPWSGLVNYGVLVSERPEVEGACFAPLLGSFKLNRSLIGGFPNAVKVRMRGEASIVISRNSFDGNIEGLNIEDSNALVSVSENQFRGFAAHSVSSCFFDNKGLVVANRELPNGDMRLDVYGNSFDLYTYDFCEAYGIELDQGFGMTPINAVISGNQFRLDEEIGRAFAIHSSGVAGAVVSGNIFRNFDKSERVGIKLSSSSSTEENLRWTIVSNRGSPIRGNGFTVDLGGAYGALIGPGQGAIVLNGGEGNIVLPQRTSH